MDKITIKYSISRTVALTEGRAEFGQASYQPTDIELQSLTLEDRLFLDSLNLNSTVFALPTGVPPTWPNIADSINAARQAALDKHAAELADREAHIVGCLAEPDERWFSESTDWRYSPAVKSVSISIPDSHVRNYFWCNQDPRIVARIASLQPELERRRAIANEQNARAQAEHEAAEARKELERAATEQAKAQQIAEVNHWCVAYGPEHLARGAREGYDVVGGCAQWLAEQLQVACGGTIIRDNTSLWDRYSWKVRKSPGPKAFEVFDAVKQAVKALAHPSSATIEVKRIMCVEVELDDDPKRTFTAVIVSVTHPAAAMRCLVVEV